MTLKDFCKIPVGENKMKHKRRSGLLCPLTPDTNGSTEIDGKPNGLVKTGKTKEDEAIVKQLLSSNEFLAKILSDTSLKQLLDCMSVRQVYPGDLLLMQGEINSQLLVTIKGTFEKVVGEKRVEKFHDPKVFEEISILHSAKSCQTVRALSEGKIYFLDCLHYRKLRTRLEIKKRNEFVDYLKNVPSFAKATDDRLYCLSDLLHEKFISPAKPLVKEGEIIDNFLIVTSGSATILTRDQNRKLDKLTKGCFFGENIFLKEMLSVYTIIADPPGVHCLSLSRKDFLEHYEDLEDFMHEKTYVFHDFPKDEKFEHVKLENLKKIKILGVGGFGKVELVQDTKNKDNIFALKSMKKQEINGKSQIEQVYNEKDLQLECQNNFIVRLYQTFRDSKYIYFLLEVCMGGDLWNLLRRQRRKCFDTDTAKFYAGCILEALNYLHKKDIVYRDLKPENVMVTASGYLKVTDFGFAKKLKPNEFSYSFVGTAEYVAPELIQNLPHDKGVDYWALGVFIFEMLVGKSPFTNEEHNDLKTYKAILKGIDFVTFPYIVSPRARNLIKKLCQPASIDRIGCLKNGIQDIQTHPWFSKLDWEKLRRQELEPPIRISLNGRTDTRYFENFDEQKEDVADDFSLWDKDF
ncbi:hypothetical protein ABEB36_002627 [Hypothenemus hampei]|uniref:cGMP-dependent protein kinase n=1 Tax=Hypothenemus hampei TaxID=57062 RepID=A0ABD1F6F7_HYPHA